ncbi:leucine-rich repeat-containing protein 69-like isoform X1 [Lineus longissimus]|uniref:leucine-rich repeat-containing protein 69-like isoform X1 n=1 Tax=Lineus longissimus TaxID=88925 RepID=UPI00315D0A19
MADTLLLRALKSQPKLLNLNNKKLDNVPKLVGKLTTVNHIQLKSNNLRTLPKEFSTLLQLEILNLGNNVCEDLPEVLQYVESLRTLHIFNNYLVRLNPSVVSSLVNLTVLNLNNNKLETLPPEICRLSSLEYLSMDNNEMIELPVELCAVTTLREMRAAGNKLNGLPLEFGFLINLEKLYLQKNRIKELPESLGKMYNLRVLDIAANQLRIFPTELASLPLKELYCEENPLLDNIPVHSIQEEEVLSLKEMCARYVMKELKNRWSYLRRSIRHFPQIREMLAQSSRCAVCGESFLNTWLECVQFIDGKKVCITPCWCRTLGRFHFLLFPTCRNRMSLHCVSSFCLGFLPSEAFLYQPLSLPNIKRHIP